MAVPALLLKEATNAACFPPRLGAVVFLGTVLLPVVVPAKVSTKWLYMPAGF